MALSDSTAARPARNTAKRADEAILETDAQFIGGLKLFSGESNSESGSAGQNAQNSPAQPAGNYLAREGDSMVGPLALGPPVNFRVEIGLEDEINISPLLENAQYSSNIELDAIQPNSFVLTRIDGAAFDGQILIIRTFGPDSFTISQMTMANGGNIQTPTDDDLILGALQMIMLVFDEALIAFSNTGGTWRVLSGADSGGGGTGDTGTFISSALSVDQALNLAVTNHVEFDTNTPPTGADGGIVLQTGAGQANGIFELKSGVTYYLSGGINPILGATSVVEVGWYDITNAQELGRRAQYNNTTNAASQKKAEIIFTPDSDVTVELRIFTVSGTFTQINALQSFGNIFEFSGKNGEPGPAGSVAWKDPARAKTLVDIPNLAAFTVLTDGITLIQGDRVLLTEQVTQSENGLWEVGVVALGLAPLTRPTDFDTDAEVISETFVAIEEGVTSKDTLWHLTSNNPLTIDVSNQVWDVFAPGTSGGPNMGGGEDGIDGAGFFVNDGRIAVAFDRLKRWEQISDFLYPNRFIRDLIYLPAQFTNPTSNGRVVMCGGNQSINRSSTYSDNYGNSWIGSVGGSNNYTYNRMSYDPVGNVLVMCADLGPGTPSQLLTVLRSTDRGTNWSNTGITSGTTLFRDVVWSANDSQFVMIAANTPANAVWTSPDGSTWTQQTSPTPITNPAFSWNRITYAPALGIYLVLSNSGFDVMTSPDGINWTAFDITLTTPNGVGNRRLIWSEGQRKFCTVQTTGRVHLSPDGINWNNNIIPGAPILRDVLYAPDLSLFLVMTDQDTGTKIFWASNDGENWSNFPTSLSMRSNLGTLFGTGFNKGAIAYAEEWGYFFGCAGSLSGGPNDTALSWFFRTEVYFNTKITA